MKCPKCHAENPVTKKFCHECGTRLIKACPKCGSEVGPADKFYGDCGNNCLFSASLIRGERSGLGVWGNDRR